MDDTNHHAVSEATARLQKAALVLDDLATQVGRETDAVVSSGDMASVAVFYFNLKEAHEALDTAVKRIYAVHDSLNKHHLPTLLTARDVEKLAVPSIGRSFYVVTKYSASFVDKDAGFGWLRDRGAGSLITETVNAGTLASYLKDLVLEENVEPPADIFKFSSYNTTGVSRYTPKAKK